MSSTVSWLCVGLGAVSTAYGGVVVHMSAKGSADSASKSRQIIYAQDGLLRVDKLDDQGQVREFTLIRDGAIWNVDMQQHTYQKFDKNMVAAKQSEMSDRLKVLMQNMPPERRAMAEQRLKAMQQQTHDYELTDLRRTEKVGSYSCELWQAAREGKPVSEYCVAAKGVLTGGEELVNAAHRASLVAADVASAAPQMASALSPVYKLYGKLDGFPVMTRHLSDGQGRGEMFVTTIERKSLAANQFAIPKGYTEVAQGKPDGDN